MYVAIAFHSTSTCLPSALFSPTTNTSIWAICVCHIAGLVNAVCNWIVCVMIFGKRTVRVEYIRKTAVWWW